MPQDASFAIRKDVVAAAGESVMDCKKKLENLARSLESVESGLQGQSGALTMMSGAVRSLREGMLYQAQRTERIGAAARWCAFRYDNADRSLLNEPLRTLDALSPSPVKPPVPVSLEAIKEMAKKEIGSKTMAVQGAGTSVDGRDTKPESDTKTRDGGDSRLDEKGRAKVSGSYQNYVVGKKAEWNNSWKRSSEKTQTFESVDVAVGKDKEGNRTEKVKGYTGLVESGGVGVALFTVTKAKSYDVTNFDGNLSSLDNAASTLSEIEKGLSHNPGMLKDYDWSKGTWEREPDPEHPDQKRWTRKEGGEAAENAFSKDIVGAKIADVTLIDEKRSAFGKQIFGDKGKAGEYDLSVSAGDICAKAALSAGIYYTIKDGKKCLAVGAEGEIGASATALTVNAKGQIHIPKSKTAAEWLGDEFQYAEAEAKGEVKVGHAEAKAGGKARWIAGKGPELVAEGNAGAYLAKANGTVSGTLMGIKGSATGEVSVGIGISGKFGITGGKIRAEFGAALGIGAKISFDVDIGGAVDGVKNVISKGFQTVKDSVPSILTRAVPIVETAKRYVTDVGDAVVNLTKRIFSWW